MEWNSVVALVLSLGGFAAFVTVAVNILKVIKIKGVPIIKDGDSPKWTGGITLVGIIALYVTKLFLPSFDPGLIDKTLLEVATVATYILSFVGTLGLEKIIHTAVKGIPLIGKSYSYDRQLAELKANG